MPSTPSKAPPTVWLLPFIEQGGLFEEIVANGGVEGPLTGFNYNGGTPSIPPIYICPSDQFRTVAATLKQNTVASFGSYACNGQVFGTVESAVANGMPVCFDFKWFGATTLNSITDGTSNTVFWSEKLSLCQRGAFTGGTRWPANRDGHFMPVIGHNERGGAMSPDLHPQVRIGKPDQCDWFQPSTSHTTLQVALGDGSVRSIAGSISKLTFNIAFAPRDCMELPPDW